MLCTFDINIQGAKQINLKCIILLYILYHKHVKDHYDK